MKKQTELLQDAIGMIDDDLVLDAQRPRRAKPREGIKPSLLKWGSLAACLAVAITAATFAFLPNNSANVTDTTSPNDPPSDPQHYTPTVAENLWELDDFQAISLIYGNESTPSSLSTLIGNGQFAFISSTESSSDTHEIASKTLILSSDKTIKVESLIAERYAVYYIRPGVPAFYDLVEKRVVDLEERIIGDEKADIEIYISKTMENARQLYPGMLDTENNQAILIEYIKVVAGDLQWDTDSITPDTDFMDELDEFRYMNEKNRKSAFFTCCGKAFYQTLDDLNDAYLYQPYRVEVFGIDSINGTCLAQVRDIIGNSLEYIAYDIVSDTYNPLPRDLHNTLLGTMITDGYSFLFSADGTAVTVAYPECGIRGVIYSSNLLDRYVIENPNRWVHGYDGENIGVFFLDTNKAYRLDSETIKGSSNAFISESGAVVYYKQMRESAAEKEFPCSDAVWYNRLQLYNRDSDVWVFCTFDEQGRVNRTSLHGNFVRLIADETAVIMERGGEYFVYSLSDGLEITDAVKSVTVEMMAHERLAVYYEDGCLYAKDLFSDTAPQLIAETDEYILSNDGAFVFAYKQGDSYVICINIASLDSCRIDIDPQLCQQLFSTEGAVFKMNYNEDGNTLSFSFYKEEDATAGETQTDFYALLDELNNYNSVDETGMSTPYSDYGKLITDVTVSEKILEEFRRFVKERPTYSPVNIPYPCGLSYADDRFSLFEKLEITPPEDYLHVNGTKFILYSSNNESLILYFDRGWLLSDFRGRFQGFHFEYTLDGKTHYIHMT